MEINTDENKKMAILAAREWDILKIKKFKMAVGRRIDLIFFLIGNIYRKSREM